MALLVEVEDRGGGANRQSTVAVARHGRPLRDRFFGGLHGEADLRVDSGIFFWSGRGGVLDLVVRLGEPVIQSVDVRFGLSVHVGLEAGDLRVEGLIECSLVLDLLGLPVGDHVVKDGLDVVGCLGDISLRLGHLHLVGRLLEPLPGG